MNTSLDNTTLLTLLSKRFVGRELGLDMSSFISTPDTAWVSFAGRLVTRQNSSLLRRSGQGRAKNPVSSKREVITNN